jgi:hypothetical protein
MHFRDVFFSRDLAPGILLQMELAPLLEYPGEFGINGRAHSAVVIGADNPQAVKTSLDRAFQKVAPVDLSFIECDFGIQDMPVAFIIHVKGHLLCCFGRFIADPHLLIGRIQHKVWNLPDFFRIPGGYLLVQFFGYLTDLYRRDGSAAQDFDDV